MPIDLKLKLTGDQWRHHADRTIALESGEEVQLVIRRPPRQVVLAAFEAAVKAGEVDENKEPTSAWNGVRLMARLAIACIFAPGAIRPLFSQADVEDIANAPWLMDLQEDVQSAMSSAKTLVESGKGNSEATPT